MMWIVFIILAVASSIFTLYFYRKAHSFAQQNPDAWLEEARNVEEWRGLTDKQLLRRASIGYYAALTLLVLVLIFIGLGIVDLLFYSIEIFAF